MFKVLSCIATAHDLRIVILAALVCFSVSLLACSLFSFAVRASREARLLWLGSAAIAAGSGFWATHFIAMLSFRPGLAVGYDPMMVVLAWLVAVLGSGLALLLLSVARTLTMRVLSGAAFGLSGAMMHYTAMSAFRTQGVITADPAYVTASVLLAVGVVVAFNAMTKTMRTWRDRSLCALAMTLSISSLHFTGMAALQITPDPRVLLSADLISRDVLAAAVAGTLLIAVSMATLGMLIQTRASAGALSHLRDIIEAMPASLAYYDADDRIALWNARFEQRLRSQVTLEPGLPYAEIIGSSLRGGLYEEALGREAEWLKNELAARAEPFENRVVERKRAGRWLRFEERRTRDGGLVSVATDITDIKLSLSRAESADRAKTDFLSNLSHELRTPLNGVVGLTDVLASTDLTAPQREVVSAISASAQGLTSLISSILDFSELQSGEGALKLETFDPAAMVREAADLFAPAALAKGLKLHVALNTAPWMRVVGDRGRLRQVLISLLSNAVKFTEAGSVRLSLDAEEADGGHRLRIAVADTGIGFDGAQADRLFAHFEQGDGSMTRKYGGTGLGLAMSRHIADLMGAELTANSLPGHGATFIFSVTLAAADDLQGAEPAPSLEAEPALERQADSEAEEHPLRVLLADDHPTNRQVVELILGSAHAAMTSVENGALALEAFQHDRYDLVLMDLQMPVMDGLTAMKAIRDYEVEAQLPRTPMIALTANVLAEHVAASLAAGADRHLGKPITAARLLEEIGSVFERHSAANDVADAA